MFSGSGLKVYEVQPIREGLISCWLLFSLSSCVSEPFSWCQSQTCVWGLITDCSVSRSCWTSGNTELQTRPSRAPSHQTSCAPATNPDVKDTPNTRSWRTLLYKGKYALVDQIILLNHLFVQVNVNDCNNTNFYFDLLNTKTNVRLLFTDLDPCNFLILFLNEYSSLKK